MWRRGVVGATLAACARCREMPGAAEFIADHCQAHDWDDTGKPRIAWDDQAARNQLVSALVNDALAIIDHFAGAQPGKQAGQALALLALVAGQDVEPANGSDDTDGRWPIARRVTEDRIVSTVDSEARHIHKTGRARQYSRCETAKSPPTHGSAHRPSLAGSG